MNKFNSIRKFGIEIEAVNVDQRTLQNVAASKGVHIQIMGYNHITQSCWKIVSDQSIRGTQGAEIVSPVLSGSEGAKQLKIICESLQEIGAKVNKSCGIHVHLDAPELNEKQMVRLANFYSRNEGTIDSFMPKSRRKNNNRFCRSMEEVVTRIDNHTEIRNLSRYAKVNFRSWYRQGTIEFRQHSGTIEFDKISNWVLLCNQILEAGIKLPVKTKAPMQKAYFKKYLTIDPTVWKFFTVRAKTLCAA